MDLIRSDKTLFDTRQQDVVKGFRKWRAMNRLAGKADAAARLGGYHAFVRDWLNTRKAGPAFESWGLLTFEDSQIGICLIQACRQGRQA